MEIREMKLVACSMHFYYGTFPFAAPFGGLNPFRNEKGATKEWCKKHGVKKEPGKRASEVGTPAGPLEAH